MDDFRQSFANIQVDMRFSANDSLINHIVTLYSINKNIQPTAAYRVPDNFEDVVYD